MPCRVATFQALCSKHHPGKHFTCPKRIGNHILSRLRLNIAGLACTLVQKQVSCLNMWTFN